MEIVGRSTWGFRAARSVGSAPRSRSGLVVHHTVTPEWTGYTGFRRLNELMIRMGYAMVAYPLLIDVTGLIGAGRPLNVIGGHTRGYNTDRHGVALIGDFSNKRPPDAMEEALVWVYRHGIDRDWWDALLEGHRDLGNTACPGGSAYARLGAYRSGNLDGGGGNDRNARSSRDSIILRRGSGGAAVRRWQLDLMDWNSSALPRYGADGDFGQETEEWTKRSQRAAGISVDGVVGPQSRSAMEVALTPTPTPSPRTERKYNMVIYARRDTPDSLSAYTVLSQHNAFAVLTHSRGEAREALERNETVVAVGGPAAEDLPSGAETVVGNTRGETLRKFMDWADENL